MGFIPFGPTIGNLPAPLPVADGGTGQITAAAAFNALNPNAVPVSAQPANPAATSSTSLVMMGLAVPYTPSSSGKVIVVISAVVSSLTAASNVNIGGRFGTGAAPANGAAVAGTRFGGTADPEIGTALSPVMRSISFADLLSLVAGTAYWLDLALSTTNPADAAQLQNVSFAIAELPAG
jgi:hypothetical protein